MPTVDVSISVGADDGRVFDSPPSFDNSAGNIPAGYYDENMHAFVRWQGVTISGRIMVAYIKVSRGTPSGAGTPELRIYGIKEDNPDAPTSYSEFMADPLTEASVDWDGYWASGWNQSPSLVPIFQELVNTFEINNEAVMLQIRNDHGVTQNPEWNSFDSRDTTSTLQAQLHIEYTDRRIFVVTTGGVSW